MIEKKSDIKIDRQVRKIQLKHWGETDKEGREEEKDEKESNPSSMFQSFFLSCICFISAYVVPVPRYLYYMVAMKTLRTCRGN